MRQLPPFAAIRAFEAAARHSSFKAAAEELGLTPTAVSHQIARLEDICERRLFRRIARQVEPTAEGKALAEALAPALDAMASAFAALAAGRGRSNVTLGAGPIFASRWIVPRLGAFWTEHPDIDLWLHHSPLPVWQQMDRFDLAIAWGKGGWPGLTCVEFLRIQVSPVLAPAIAAGTGDRLLAPEDLLGLPLLHHRDDKGWRQWLRAAGVTVPRQLSGSVFEDSNVLLQATLAGRGVSLGILGFVDDELSAGRLVQPFARAVDPGDAYYLVWREQSPAGGVMLAVRDWLLAQAGVP